MREIKFRVFAKEQKRIVNVDRLGLNPDGSIQEIMVTVGELENSDSQEWSVLEAGEFELMQYTGLKDINGREIYEGDIVKFGPLAPYPYRELLDNDEEGIVRFELGCFVVVPTYRPDERYSLDEAGSWVAINSAYKIYNIYRKG